MYPGVAISQSNLVKWPHVAPFALCKFGHSPPPATRGCRCIKINLTVLFRLVFYWTHDPSNPGQYIECSLARITQEDSSLPSSGAGTEPISDLMYSHLDLVTIDASKLFDILIDSKTLKSKVIEITKIVQQNHPRQSPFKYI